MPFTIPNQGAASFAQQAAPDNTDILAMVAAAAVTGIMSGCAVTANGSTLVLSAAAGVVRIGGRRVAVTAGTVTIATADATNPRRDIVTVNTSGTLAITAGTPAAVTSTTGPVKPAIPASSVLLAEAYVPAGGTAALSTWLTDKGLVISDPGTENSLWYGAKGDTRIIADAAITSGGTSLTSATAAFTAADTGKSVTVAYAGASGAQLVTTITFVNSTTVTTAASAGATVTGAWASIGTNDATAMQAWINACAASGNPGILAVTGPATYYRTNTQLTLPAGTVLYGGGGTDGTTWIDGAGINADHGAIMLATGTDGTAYTMSANVSEGAMSIATATAPGATLVPGAWIRVEDTQSSATGGMLNGEIVQVDTVAAVTGTTTVFLRTGLNSPSYLTASTAKFTVLSLLNAISLNGIGFQCAVTGPRYIDTIQASSTVIASAVGTSLIVASGAKFAVNQFVQAGLPNEIMKITGITSNTLTVTRAQAGSLAIATLAQGMQVAALPLTPMRQTGVQFTKCFAPTVTNCSFNFCQEDGIGMTDCLYPRVQNSYFSDVMDYGYAAEAGDTANGYGIALTGATQWGVITGNQGLRCKFLVCMTGSTGQGGCPRAHVVEANTATDGFYGGFDCHPGADDIDFTGNVVNYTREIGFGQYDAFFVDGGRVTVRGNKVRGAGRHGILVNNNNLLRTLRATIEGNEISFCGYYDTANVRGRGIYATCNSVDHTVESVCIRNNDVRYCAASEIQLVGPATAANYPHSVIVSGNTTQHGVPSGLNAGATLPSIQLANILTGVVSGNVVRQDNAAADGIFITTSTDTAVTGNTVECTAVASAAAGIHLTTCTDMTIIGNRVKKHWNSLLTDTSSDFCTVAGNDFRSSVSTALTVSGTGNKISGNIGYNPSGKWAGQPAVGASPLTVTNTSNVDQAVYLNGGTVSAISIGGVATGVATTGREFRVPAGQTLTITYSSAPTWTWFGD